MRGGGEETGLSLLSDRLFCWIRTKWVRGGGGGERRVGMYSSEFISKRL